MADRAREDAMMAQHLAAMAELRKIPGVVRVAFGLKEVGGQPVPQWAYRVYVSRKRPLSELPPEERIPPEIGGFRTDVLAGGDEQIGQTRKTPTLSPGNKITRYIPNEMSGSGTLALLVRKGTDRFILTNHHVLDDDVMVNEQTSDVYSPELKTCAGIQCNNPAARINQGRGVEDRVQFEGKTYFVDATLATIYAGVEGSNVMDGVGALDQGLRDLATVPLTGSQPTGAVTVRKRGAVTGLTQGTVVEMFRDVDTPEGAVTVWEFQVRPDPVNSDEYREDFVLAPDQDADLLVSQFVGKAVQAQREVSGGHTVVHLSGRVFSRKGDSGSCVVDESRRIVGLLNGYVYVNARVMKNGQAEDEHIPTGNSTICYIRPVFHSMALEEGTGVIPVGSPSSGAVEMVPAVAGLEWQAPEAPEMEEIEAALMRTPAGQKLLALVRRHAEQVAHLVHHRRRVMVTWHRSHGPAHAAALLNALREPGGRFPTEVDGVPLAETLIRMRAVLLQEGDAELRDAILKNGDFILALVQQATSVPEVLDALAAADEKCLLL